MSGEQNATPIVKMIPIRSKKTFKADDGRCVEEYTKIKEIETVIEKDTPLSVPEGIETDPFYIGAIVVVGPNGIPQEIKFHIDAKDMDEAFSKFHDTAKETMDQMHQEMVKQQQEQSEHIVPATARDMENIEQTTKQHGGIGGIMEA